VNELKQPDYAARIHCCNWLPENVHAEEAWFYHSGHVRMQNVRKWSEENPHSIQRVPSHSVKEGVWYSESLSHYFSPVHEFRSVCEQYIESLLQPTNIFPAR
jgi:hypothetical protein